MQSYRNSIFCLLMMTGAVLIFSIAEADTLFEDDFTQGLDNWELTEAGGSINIEEGDAPEYGPKMMVIDQAVGSNTLAVVKNLELTDGIIEMLWKDAALPEDADGPLIARKQEAGEAWYLVELDTDTGLHFDVVGGAGVVGATGQMSSGEWSWLKWRLEGELLQAKTWLATEDEPEEWEIEAEDGTYQTGGVGLRCWSGVIHAAFYRVTDLEGPSMAVQPGDKLATRWGEIKN